MAAAWGGGAVTGRGGSVRRCARAARAAGTVGRGVLRGRCSRLGAGGEGFRVGGRRAVRRNEAGGIVYVDRHRAVAVVVCGAAAGCAPAMPARVARRGVSTAAAVGAVVDGVGGGAVRRAGSDCRRFIRRCNRLGDRGRLGLFESKLFDTG